MRYYNIDLRDALWGAEWRRPSTDTGWMGVRRLRSLIDGLPVDSAFVREMDPKQASFQLSVPELLSLLAEVLDAHRLDYIQAKSEKGWKRPDALRIPRPWDEVEETKVATGDEFAAFLNRLAVN